MLLAHRYYVHLHGLKIIKLHYHTHPRVYVGESEVDNFRFVYITDSRSLFMMLLVFDDSLKM